MDCIKCALKHLGDAIIKMEEFYDGNEAHEVEALCHLDQAAQHLRGIDPVTATLICQERKAIEADLSRKHNIRDLFLGVYRQAKERGFFLFDHNVFIANRTDNGHNEGSDDVLESR